MKGGFYMELARITEKGQITLPVRIRKKLGVKEGDKLLFIEEENRVFVANSTIVALKEAQSAFDGEAERIGLKDERDVAGMIKEIRKERRLENADND
jgi:AbrB family looped-hinge helix DNA binding protein